MMSGIFGRRRAVLIAAGLMAGTALGAGVPSLVWHSPHSSAAAATTTITLQPEGSGSLTFTKLGGITYDEPNVQSCSAGTCTYTPNAAPPTVTLRAQLATNVATYQDLMAWEARVREGNPTGRVDATLTLLTSTGATITQYVLENAWPSNVDLPTGNPQTLYFTVVLQCDSLISENS